jgi:hypothetical protein
VCVRALLSRIDSDPLQEMCKVALEASFQGKDGGHNLAMAFLSVEYGPFDHFSGFPIFFISQSLHFRYQVLTVLDIYDIIYINKAMRYRASDNSRDGSQDEGSRAMTPRGRAQKSKRASRIHYSATEEIAAPQRPGRNLPFDWERACQW